MRLFIAILAFAFAFNVNAQDDRFKGFNKKELKALILDVEEQNRIQVKDLVETIDTCSQHIIELDLFLNQTQSILNFKNIQLAEQGEYIIDVESIVNAIQSTLDSTLEQLSERDKYILDIGSTATITQHEIDSLRKVFQALNNPELLSKINYYTSSWNSMCYLEKIVALLGEDSDWYTAILPELNLTEDQSAVLHSLYADEDNRLPQMGVIGCSGWGVAPVYRLDDDWCVGLDATTTSDDIWSDFTTIVLMSTKFKLDPVVLVITSLSEMYISDDCNILVTRQNVNPCEGKGLTYDLLYFEDNLLGTLKVNCGGDEDGYGAPAIPSFDLMGLSKAKDVITLTAWDDVQHDDGPYLEFFELTKVSVGLSQNSLFNLDIFRQRARREFTFLKKLSKL